MKDDNKLIAEFMGLSIKEGVCYYTDADDMFPMGIEVEEPYLPYHTSWDWLIPVVNKIEMECEGVPIQLLDCNLYSEIGEVYQAVVEFIKEHNEVNRLVDLSKYICGSCGDRVNTVAFNEDKDVDECVNCM